MKSLCLIFIVLIIIAGARADKPRPRGLDPENDIDILAYRVYQRRLREEQAQRQMQRQLQLEQQQNSMGNMEGNQFHQGHQGNSDVENHKSHHHKLHEFLERGPANPGPPHREEKKPKPDEGIKKVAVDKVINVDESEQGEPHPTPAYHQIGEDSKLNSMHKVASMADVYFLDLKRDVAERDLYIPSSTATSDGTGGASTAAPRVQAVQANPEQSDNTIVFTAVVAGCSVAGLVGLVVAGVCWYRLQKNVKAASEAEYPAYGITGPTKERVQSPGDRKLAQSAQMYHYQHQKQQMIALEKANSEMKHDGSDEESEEENEEGDYTVYECPGLAPTGEMEVKNPLFTEETPVTPTAPSSADHK